MFDPERLKSEAGRKELREIADSYYKTTHDAIRRYDKHHLILGDRYEANAPIAMEVVEAAMPYVDVLSFQDFRDPVKHLDEWHKKTGKPVLLADAAGMRIKSTGFFKSNVSTMVGQLYRQHDSRRDAGFTIFYMGINIGAFLSPLTCGYLGEVHDWSYGFFAAGLGIVLGTIVFWRNMSVYEDQGVPPKPELR